MAPSRSCPKPGIQTHAEDLAAEITELLAYLYAATQPTRNATDPELDSEAIDVAAHHQRGREFGYAAAIIGLIGAYSGISLDLANGGMSLGVAGAFYGRVGAVFGASCTAIGWRSDKRSRRLE